MKYMKGIKQALRSALEKLEKLEKSSSGSFRAAQAQGDNREIGPLEAHWCKEAGVSRVRRSGDRNFEQQAAFNLKFYKGYTNKQIDQAHP